MKTRHKKKNNSDDSDGIGSKEEEEYNDNNDDDDELYLCKKIEFTMMELLIKRGIGKTC